MTDESRRLHWEKVADWPLTITAVLFLVAYAAQSWTPVWPTRCPPSSSW